MEHLRKLLDKFMDTSDLSDIEVIRIIESIKEDTFIKLDELLGGGVSDKSIR